MVTSIKLGPIKLSKYANLISAEVFSEIEVLAKKLAGLKVVHLNTTATGGGVAEILHTLVPLLNGVGLKTKWYTIKAQKEFFEVSKQIHNYLQGKKGDLTEDQRQLYLHVNEKIARDLTKINPDVWIIHDPQVAAVIDYHPNLHPSTWRCHIDMSRPNIFVWHFILPFIQKYDRYVFTMRKFIGSGLDFQKAKIFTPAIDPLSVKNRSVSSQQAKSIVSRFGIDLEKPLVSQISRFDPWKDPWGVIDAFRLAKKEINDLQLALIGAFAADDPEANEVVADIKKYAKSDPDIFILSNQDRVFNLEVNAFQMASNVIIQKSTKEGFGLTVSEAMWKGKPVIGGKADGIVGQIVDGETGFLVTTAAQTAEKIVCLLKNPDEAVKMGKKGKERVREKFLTTRLLLDHLKLYDELV
jgi:trehalose synthase